MSTKTWQERFDKRWPTFERFGDVDEVKQFISDLRKRDMEALIGMLPFGHRDDMGGLVEEIKQLIKDYYEN